eukprot:1754074-Pyramimonas_sp.AAC.1
MRTACAPGIIAVFANLIFSAPVTSLGSRYACRFALSCADRAHRTSPVRVTEKPLHVPVRSLRRSP